MTAASIVITQSGVSSAGGKSRRDIALSSLVTLTNEDDSGVRSWRWRLLEAPPGSSATLTGTISPSSAFTPDVPGTYVLELSVDDGRTGQVSRVLAAVLTNFNGLLATPVRIPSAKERLEANWNYKFGATGDPNDTGSWADLMEWLQELSQAAALVNSIDTPLVTGTATSGGGTVDFTIDVGTPIAKLNAIRLVSNAGSNLADLELFADSSRTLSVYQQTGIDPSTEFIDTSPITLIAAGFATLENNTLYGRITNDGGTDSTYNVQALIGVA